MTFYINTKFYKDSNFDNNTNICHIYVSLREVLLTQALEYKLLNNKEIFFSPNLIISTLSCRRI